MRRKCCSGSDVICSISASRESSRCAVFFSTAPVIAMTLCLTKPGPITSASFRSAASCSYSAAKRDVSTSNRTGSGSINRSSNTSSTRSRNILLLTCEMRPIGSTTTNADTPRGASVSNSYTIFLRMNSRDLL